MEYKKRPFTGDITTHNLNITGEEMTLWERKYLIFKDAFPNLTGASVESLQKTGNRITKRLMLCLKMKTRMKMRMIFPDDECSLEVKNLSR
jgi:hypothetical protein